MGRGGAIYLSYTALVLLAVPSSVSAEIKGLWKISIDESPAPSPEDGPPFSAHAVRDRGALPYEIVAIVGAYLAFVVLLGTLLLTVGRKLRKQAQEMASKPQEMVKPMIRTFDPSPVSPDKAGAWYARKFGSKKGATATVKTLSGEYGSPIDRKTASFDMNVIENDRLKREEEMTRIYAEVMAFEDNKSSRVHGQPMEIQSDAPPLPPPPQGYPSPVSHVRVSSSGSAKTTASGQSNRKGRRAIPSLKIQKEYGNNNDGALDPLSPMHGPATARTLDSQYAPTTPGTGVSWQYPYDEYVQRDSLDEPHAQPRAVPHPAPQRGNSYGMHEQQRGPTPTAATRLDPIRTTSITSSSSRPGNNASATNLNHSLPLRQYGRVPPNAQPSIQSQVMFPLSPGHWDRSLLSPTGLATPRIQQTILAAREDGLGAGPITGLPTPYSPYMPQTPMTPVTPHLTSRAERRQREREYRTIQGVITEEDAVADERDMWDSGY